MNIRTGQLNVFHFVCKLLINLNISGIISNVILWYHVYYVM